MDDTLSSPRRTAYSSTVTRTPKPRRHRDSLAHRRAAFYDSPSPSQYGELPSIVVEDITLVSTDDSALSADASLGRSFLGSPRTPVWKAFPNVDESVGSDWAEEPTLTSTPQCGRKDCSLEKPWVDASMLKEYPKSPPLGRPRTDSLRTFASSMEVLKNMSSSDASMMTLHPAEERSQKRSIDGASRSPTAKSGKTRASTSLRGGENQSVHTTKSLRKCGPSANLRESYVQNLSGGEDSTSTLDPRYAFEYQLTLAMLDAMERRATPHRPKAAAQSEKPSQRLSAPFTQTLGSLRRRMPLGVY